MSEWHGFDLPAPTWDTRPILNETWPLADADGRPHARGIPDTTRVPVWMRLEIGEPDSTVTVEWRPGILTRVHTHPDTGIQTGYVEHVDVVRRQAVGVWLRRQDITPRQAP